VTKYPHNQVDGTTFFDLTYVGTGTEILARWRFSTRQKIWPLFWKIWKNFILI